MSVSKQGGVLNYLGKQEIVKAPKHWKSSHNSPKTELAYITDAEKGLLVDANLHGSLLNKPNIGPSSLLSFDGGDPVGGYGEGGSWNGGGDKDGGSDRDPSPPHEKKQISTPTIDYEEEAAQIPGYKEYGATGWTGDAGVDAWESQHGDQSGSYDYQGSIFTGGTYATDDTPASRTIRYGNDSSQQNKGRPDITYFSPTGTTMGNYKSGYEMNQIKHIQDEKLKTVKGKLRVAGFTDLPDDANFQQTKDYITELNRDGKILDSWRNAKDKDGNPLYDRVDPNTGETTIEKWDRENYFPQSASMTHWSTDVLGKVSPSGTAGAPLSFDQLMNDFDLMEKVGKSGGGAMDWKERMKTFSPKQYEVFTGTVYNPHTQTYTPRDQGEGSADERLNRIAAPYQVGGTAPQVSQAAKWYANMGGGQGGFNLTTAYASAKAKQASILGNPSSIGQLAVNQSPYYDFLKLNKLDRGIL